METTTRLQYGKTHRLPNDPGIASGIYVMSVGPNETTAHLNASVYSDFGNGTLVVKMDVDGLRALAADLLTAAAFIEENAAQRAVNELTNNAAA